MTYFLQPTKTMVYYKRTFHYLDLLFKYYLNFYDYKQYFAKTFFL